MNNRIKTAEVSAAKPVSVANGTACKDEKKEPAKQGSMEYQAGFTSGYSL